MKLCLLAASLTTFLVTAAVAEEFYVVKNPKTADCKISSKKDDGERPRWDSAIPDGKGSQSCKESGS